MELFPGISITATMKGTGSGTPAPSSSSSSSNSRKSSGGTSDEIVREAYDIPVEQWRMCQLLMTAPVVLEEIQRRSGCQLVFTDQRGKVLKVKTDDTFADDLTRQPGNYFGFHPGQGMTENGYLDSLIINRKILICCIDESTVPVGKMNVDEDDEDESADIRFEATGSFRVIITGSAPSATLLALLLLMVYLDFGSRAINDEVQSVDH